MEENLEVSKLIKPLVDIYKVLGAEWKNYFKEGLTDYLHSQTEKYSLTNTFLHRSGKVKFDSIYYPIKAKHVALTTDFSNLKDVFEEYKKITIIGSAGSGKTTLMRHIFLTSIKSKWKIPILIELRCLNEYEGDFEKSITEKILKLKVKPNDITFKRTLESGNFLFLLDGYDEIFSNKKQEINRQIEMFVDAYSKNYFLITTRPGSGIENSHRFYNFSICPLQDLDVKGFISKIVTENEKKERLLKIIGETKNNNYLEYLRNPLLLSMFILACESHPEIPKKKSAFYNNVFDTLYSRHDGITKNGFPREKKTKLQREDFEYILSIFSYLSLNEGIYSFTQDYMTNVLLQVRKASGLDFVIEDLIYDLRTSISILVLDGYIYSFPHRSMQEYFTAIFIAKLPPNKKSKVYNNVAGALQISSADNSHNLWSIFYEIDETFFISKFLIPKLKDIYEKLNLKVGKQLIDDYFEIIDPIMIYRKLLYNTESEKLYIFRHHSMQNSVLEFSSAYEYDLLLHFPSSSGAENELLELYNLDSPIAEYKQQARSPVYIAEKDDYIAILIKYGIVDIIKKLREQIHNKITEWEIAIKKKKSTIDKLLRL